MRARLQRILPGIGHYNSLQPSVTNGGPTISRGTISDFRRRYLWLVVAAGAAMCVAVYLLERHAGFDLADGSDFWYCVQRVMLGEVPIRDFASYDPGRYYWVAGWLWIFHTHGIVAVRTATAAFSAIGVITAGLLIWRGSNEPPKVRLGWCVLVMALCLLWMWPWWKQYDVAISIILTASLAAVISKPTVRRFFIHGVVVGVAALFGRNHGVYGLIACILAAPLLLLCRPGPRWRRCIPVWMEGVVLGFSPILIAMAIDRNFALRFVDSILFIFQTKSTNVFLPVPWPWRVAVAGQAAQLVARQWITGCFFIVLPLFCVIGAAVVIRETKRRAAITAPAFVACVLTAIPYLNVAFSRADTFHLAQTVMPFVMGVVLWPRHPRSAVATGLGLATLAMASACVAVPLHPAYAMRTQAGWEQINVRGDRMWADPATAAASVDIEKLAHKYVPAGGTILVATTLPGIYALLGMRAPVHEIYPLVHRDEEFQDQEIARLKKANPQLVLTSDFGVDGREGMLYKNTHKIIWKYVLAHYHLIDSPAREPWLKVYLRN